jgi:hypothetical protein
MALLLVFYVSYGPFHLLTERHWDDRVPSAAQATHVDLDDHEDADHNHDHDGHHRRHPASEHSIQMLAKSGSVAVGIAFLPTIATVVIEVPQSYSAPSFVERIKPPGESPPELSQPRAPPLA